MDKLLIDQICDEFAKLGKKYLFNQESDRDLLCEFKKCFENSLCHSFKEKGINNFPIEFKEGKEKNTFEPANFYTAIVIVCNKLGYNIPTPDEVDGKDIYKFKDITCSWKNNACYINLNNPCENITLDFTIMEDGSLKI